jgi:hypothetical protein
VRCEADQSLPSTVEAKDGQSYMFMLLAGVHSVGMDNFTSFITPNTASTYVMSSRGVGTTYRKKCDCIKFCLNAKRVV